MAYKNNPLMDSTSRQLSFLFGRIIYFIEEADRLRLERRFEEFAEYNQRAISVVHGLTSFFEGELDANASKAWNIYFLKLLSHLNQHMIEPNTILFKQICDSIRHMEQLLKNVDAQHHVQINKTIIENEIANENLHIPTNHNTDGHRKSEATLSNRSNDVNLSV